MMTGDSRVSKHRAASDLLLELKRRTPLMQDKAVQSSYDNDNLTMMDDTSAAAFDNHGVTANDIHVTTSSANDNVSSSVTSRNDVVTTETVVSSVTVAEINSPSTTDSSSNGPASPIYSRPYQRGGTSVSEDSGLVDEGPFGGGPLDGVDSATLELRPKHFIGSPKMNKEETDDDIKEQSPPSLLANNYKEQKLKEQFETKDGNTDDNNSCALECLAFTLECCQCVIL